MHIHIYRKSNKHINIIRSLHFPQSLLLGYRTSACPNVRPETIQPSTIINTSNTTHTKKEHSTVNARIMPQVLLLACLPASGSRREAEQSQLSNKTKTSQTNNNGIFPRMFLSRCPRSVDMMCVLKRRNGAVYCIRCRAPRLMM